VTGPVVIHVDAAEVLGWFASLSRQAPFALATGINDTLKLAQQRERAHLRESMTIRRPVFIDRSIKVSPFATKATLTGVIQIDPARDVLSKFEGGGEKRPLRGASLAVPVAVKRNKSDVIIASMRVRALQLRPYRTNAGVVRLRGLKRTFTVKRAGGGLILQRVGRRAQGGTLDVEIAGGSIRVLYAFKKSVPIPANLAFTSTVERAVANDWDRLILAAMDRATATAR